jgi:hypothetical protein
VHFVVFRLFGFQFDYRQTRGAGAQWGIVVQHSPLAARITKVIFLDRNGRATLFS